MLKKIGSTLLILSLVAIGLVQCFAQDIVVHDLNTGEWRSLLEYWLDNFDESRNWNSDVRNGYSHFQAGEFRLAIHDFTTAINSNPDNADAYAGRGFTYERLAKYEQAVEDFNKVIELDSTRAEIYAYRALCRFTMGIGLEEVIQDYDKAILLKPDYGWAYSGRGMAYAKLENWEQALSDLTKSIEFEPDNPEMYKERGRVYGVLGKLKEAVQDYSKAIELQPDYAEAFRGRGSIHMQAGNFGDAIEDFSNAIVASEGNPLDELINEMNYHLRGVAHAQMGNFEQAIQDYSEAIELDPEFEYALNMHIVVEGMRMNSWAI